MQNQNICAQEIFYHNSHLPHRSAKKVFANSLNTFEDIAFLLGRCKGKIEIFRFLYVGKFLTLLLQNQNICAQEIFNHNSHLPRLKISCAQIFWFCNSNVRNFPTYRNLKISIFPLHCPSRNAISSKVFKNFQKLFFGWKTWKAAIVVENSLWTEIWFCNSNVTTFQIQKM